MKHWLCVVTVVLSIVWQIIIQRFNKVAKGNRVTVNGDRYRNNRLFGTTTDKYSPEQQDGVICHTVLLYENVPGIAILRIDNVNWSPILYDFTSLDFFLWECVNRTFYENRSEKISDLEQN